MAEEKGILLPPKLKPNQSFQADPDITLGMCALLHVHFYIKGTFFTIDYLCLYSPINTIILPARYNLCLFAQHICSVVKGPDKRFVQETADKMSYFFTRYYTATMPKCNR